MGGANMRLFGVFGVLVVLLAGSSSYGSEAAVVGSYPYFNNVRDVRVYGAEAWWLTEGGLVRFDLRTGARETWSWGSESVPVACWKITLDGEGRPWVVAAGARLGFFEGGRLHFVPQEPSHGGVAELCTSPTGLVWVAAPDGYIGIASRRGVVWLSEDVAFPGRGGTLYIDEMAVDTRGSIWLLAASYATAYQYVDGWWVEWRSGRNGCVLPRYPHKMLADKRGRVWFTGSPHLCSYDGSSWTEYTEIEDVSDCAEGPGGRLGFLHIGSYPPGCADAPVVWVLDSGGWERLRVSGRPGYWAPRCVAMSDGGVCIGSTAGLVLYEGSGWRSCVVGQSAQSFCSGLALDWSGAVWIAGPLGLEVLREGQFSYLPDALQGPPLGCAGCRFSRDGTLWFWGAGGAGNFDGEEWMFYSWRESPFGPWMIYDLGFGPDGSVWFACDGAVWRLDNGMWQRYDASNSPLPEGFPVYSCESGANGSLYFGCGDGRIVVFRDEKWSVLPGIDQFQLGKAYGVYDLAFDPQGTLWAATNLGVGAFQAGTWRVYEDPGVTICLASEADGTLWAGTKKRGLWRFDGLRWTRHFYADYQGAEETAIYGLAVDGRGRLCFSTGSGLYVEDRNVSGRTTQISLGFDRDRYSAGDQGLASLRLSAFDDEVLLLDLYVACVPPSGGLLFLPDLGPEWCPWAAGLYWTGSWTGSWP